MNLAVNEIFGSGSPENEPDRFSDEDQHEVVLTKDFEMGETPVTQEQYEEIMGTNPSYFKNPKAPVENISWNERKYRD